MLDAFAYGRQRRKMREVFGFGGDLIADRVVAGAAAAAQSFTGPMFPPVGAGMACWMFAVAYLGEATVDLGYAGATRSWCPRCATTTGWLPSSRQQATSTPA